MKLNDLRIGLCRYLLVPFMACASCNDNDLEFHPPGVSSNYTFKISGLRGAPGTTYLLENVVPFVQHEDALFSYLLKGTDKTTGTEIVIIGNVNENTKDLTINVSLHYKGENQFYKDCNGLTAHIARGKDSKGNFITVKNNFDCLTPVLAGRRTILTEVYFFELIPFKLYY